MSSIQASANYFFTASVNILNQPNVKEGVKNLISTITFVFGLVEFYHLGNIALGQDITTDDLSAYPEWIQTANKVANIMAMVSFVISGAVSRPGVMIISAIAESVLSPSQAFYLFGQNTIFAINPWHPRHIFSLIPPLLALPSLFFSAYKLSLSGTSHPWKWHVREVESLFTIFTSRPFLHLANYLGRHLRVV